MQLLSQMGNFDQNGNVTLNFGAPGLGLALVGSLTCPGASSGASWRVSIGGVAAGSWKGESAFGPITAEGMDTVTVTGSSGTPGATALAVWHVTSYCEGQAPPAYLIGMASQVGAGAIESTPLPSPGAPITTVTNPGTTTYYYQQTILTPLGETSNPPVTTVSNGPATLSSTAFISLTPQGLPPMQSGWIIRTYRNGFHVPALDSSTGSVIDTGQPAEDVVPPAFNSTGQMLQVYSTEIDSVLSPIDDVLPGFNGNGTTLSFAGPEAYTNPDPAAYPGDYFYAAAANTWYVFHTFTRPTLIKQIYMALFTSSVTSPVVLCVMIAKANGQKIFLGSHLFVTLIDLFEMGGTTGYIVNDGDQLWLAAMQGGDAFMVDISVKYL